LDGVTELEQYRHIFWLVGDERKFFHFREQLTNSILKKVFDYGILKIIQDKSNFHAVQQIRRSKKGLWKPKKSVFAQ
jgi:hypothetical protein